MTYFEDLLEDSSLPTCIRLLEKDYDATVGHKGDIDEKVFVNEDDSLLGSGSLSGGAVNISGSKVVMYTLLCHLINYMTTL